MSSGGGQSEEKKLSAKDLPPEIIENVFRMFDAGLSIHQVREALWRQGYHVSENAVRQLRKKWKERKEQQASPGMTPPSPGVKTGVESSGSLPPKEISVMERGPEISLGNPGRSDPTLPGSLPGSLPGGEYTDAIREPPKNPPASDAPYVVVTEDAQDALIISSPVDNPNKLSISLGGKTIEMDFRVEKIQTAAPQQPPAPPEHVNVYFVRPVEIIRKVVLDPEILCLYQWARARGYTGELSDFIRDVVRLYFAEKGIRVVIERRVVKTR